MIKMGEGNMLRKDIVLYGVSQNGKDEYEYLKTRIDGNFYFCETVKRKTSFCGIPIVSLKELYKMDRSEVEVYVYDDEESESLYEKRERLINAGFANVNSVTPGMEKYYETMQNVLVLEDGIRELFEELFLFVYCHEEPRRRRRHHNPYIILDSIVEINEAYRILADDESRATFCDILRYRISGDVDFLKRRLVEPQYFMKDILSFTDSEIYVDAGAAQGDTILKFIDFVNGSFDRIYAYEAKNTYCLGLDALFEDEKRITLIPKGLYAYEGKIFFHENEHGSIVSEKQLNEYGYSIDVTSLDESIHDKVTFVKMDIEGSEMKALEGGRKLICEYKPKLAICAYHLERDLWEIPLKIKSLVKDYKIYLRHHYEEMDEETVCYATL